MLDTPLSNLIFEWCLYLIVMSLTLSLLLGCIYLGVVMFFQIKRMIETQSRRR